MKGHLATMNYPYVVDKKVGSDISLDYIYDKSLTNNEVEKRICCAKIKSYDSSEHTSYFICIFQRSAKTKQYIAFLKKECVWRSADRYPIDDERRQYMWKELIKYVDMHIGNGYVSIEPSEDFQFDVEHGFKNILKLMEE